MFSCFLCVFLQNNGAMLFLALHWLNYTVVLCIFGRCGV